MIKEILKRSLDYTCLIGVTIIAGILLIVGVLGALIGPVVLFWYLDIVFLREIFGHWADVICALSVIIIWVIEAGITMAVWSMLEDRR